MRTKEKTKNAHQIKIIGLDLCHGFKQGSNKLSDRCSLLSPALPPEEWRRRKRDRHLLIEYKKFY